MVLIAPIMEYKNQRISCKTNHQETQRWFKQESHDFSRLEYQD